MSDPDTGVSQAFLLAEAEPADNGEGAAAQADDHATPDTATPDTAAHGDDAHGGDTQGADAPGEGAQGDDTHAEVSHGDGHGEEAHADPAIPLEIWLVVALVIVFAMVWKPLKKGVLSALDGRADRIRAELDEAQRLRDDAQSALATIERQQRDALRTAEDIIAHARQDAERLRAQAAANLDAALGRREQLALDRIAQAEAAALAEVRTLAVDVAMGAAQAVLEQAIAADQQSDLIDQSITALDGRLH